MNKTEIEIVRLQERINNLRNILKKMDRKVEVGPKFISSVIKNYTELIEYKKKEMEDNDTQEIERGTQGKNKE